MSDKTMRQHMQVASYLLPDPGGEVVRQLLDGLDAAETTISYKDRVIAALCTFVVCPYPGSFPCENKPEPTEDECHKCALAFCEALAELDSPQGKGVQGE